MTRLLALSVLALALMAVPATAQVDLNEPCANPDSLPVVTVDEGVTVDLDTPVGAGIPLVGTLRVSSVDGGDYLIDLVGQPKGTTKTVDVSLSWSNGLTDELTDYDMRVNGTVYQATSNPEVASIPRGHCQTISVDEVYAYTGTPTDALVLDVSISTFSF